METLDRGFSDLTAIQIKLERKVELNTRYSNAASSYHSIIPRVLTLLPPGSNE